MTTLPANTVPEAHRAALQQRYPVTSDRLERMLRTKQQQRREAMNPTPPPSAEELQEQQDRASSRFVKCDICGTPMMARTLELHYPQCYNTLLRDSDRSASAQAQAVVAQQRSASENARSSSANRRTASVGPNDSEYIVEGRPRSLARMTRPTDVPEPSFEQLRTRSVSRGGQDRYGPTAGASTPPPLANSSPLRERRADPTMEETIENLQRRVEVRTSRRVEATPSPSPVPVPRGRDAQRREQLRELQRLNAEGLARSRSRSNSKGRHRRIAPVVAGSPAQKEDSFPEVVILEPRNFRSTSGSPTRETASPTPPAQPVVPPVVIAEARHHSPERDAALSTMRDVVWEERLSVEPILRKDSRAPSQSKEEADEVYLYNQRHQQDVSQARERFVDLGPYKASLSTDGDLNIRAKDGSRGVVVHEPEQLSPRSEAEAQERKQRLREQLQRKPRAAIVVDSPAPASRVQTTSASRTQQSYHRDFTNTSCEDAEERVSNETPVNASSRVQNQTPPPQIVVPVPASNTTNNGRYDFDNDGVTDDDDDIEPRVVLTSRLHPGEERVAIVPEPIPRNRDAYNRPSSPVETAAQVVTGRLQYRASPDRAKSPSSMALRRAQERLTGVAEQRSPRPTPVTQRTPQQQRQRVASTEPTPRRSPSSAAAAARSRQQSRPQDRVVQDVSPNRRASVSPRVFRRPPDPSPTRSINLLSYSAASAPVMALTGGSRTHTPKTRRDSRRPAYTPQPHPDEEDHQPGEDHSEPAPKSETKPKPKPAPAAEKKTEDPPKEKEAPKEEKSSKPAEEKSEKPPAATPQEEKPASTEQQPAEKEKKPQSADKPAEKKADAEKKPAEEKKEDKPAAEPKTPVEKKKDPEPAPAPAAAPADSGSTPAPVPRFCWKCGAKYPHQDGVVASFCVMCGARAMAMPMSP